MRLPLVSILALTSLGGVSSAQQASYTFFGASSGLNYGQQLTVTGLPQIGTTFTVSVGYTGGGFCLTVITPYVVWLLSGFSNQAWAGGALPAAFPQGFTLLVAPDVLIAQAVMSNNSCPPGSSPSTPSPSFNISIPNNPGLIGVRFYQQMLLASTFNGTIGSPVATNGGDALVGL